MTNLLPPVFASLAGDNCLFFQTTLLPAEILLKYTKFKKSVRKKAKFLEETVKFEMLKTKLFQHFVMKRSKKLDLVVWLLSRTKYWLEN